MGQLAVAIGLVLALAAPLQAQDQRDPLIRARTLYNQRDFEAALAAADEARQDPLRADGADLIAARAFLERYRQSAAGEDLVSARERLRAINAERLNPIERVELLVGLGETLYFEGAAGAAAAMFDLLLAGAVELTPDARERLLDWWASALDQEARPRPDIERQRVYQEIRNRMRDELRANLSSATASYWLAAAALGQGDAQGALDAAQAGWIRAPLTPDRGAALRADLDRLVTQGIAPERSKMLGRPVEGFREEWQQFKMKWEK
jgi:hypothetical protein